VTRILLLLAAAVTVACGTGAAATQSVAATRARDIAAGQVTTTGTDKLTVAARNGDVTVLYDSRTGFYATAPGTIADLKAGVCLATSGPKNASGTVVARMVDVYAASKGSCATLPIAGAGGVGGGFGGGFGGGNFSPRPAASPRPSGRPANLTTVTGLVTSAGSGLAMVKSGGGTVTLDVTNARVSVVTKIGAGAVKSGDCVVAVGKSQSTSELKATAIDELPPAGGGCFAGGFGPRGRPSPSPTTA
jgi:hypothetical protein